jgi:hypothetical protein
LNGKLSLQPRSQLMTISSNANTPVLVAFKMGVFDYFLAFVIINVFFIAYLC